MKILIHVSSYIYSEAAAAGWQLIKLKIETDSDHQAKTDICGNSSQSTNKQSNCV